MVRGIGGSVREWDGGGKSRGCVGRRAPGAKQTWTGCIKSYLRIRSISEQHRGLFRFFIPGIRNWTTMCIHCIVSGGGLTKVQKIRKSSKNFFIPGYVLRDKFKGIYHSLLNSLYEEGKLECGRSSMRQLGRCYAPI